MIKLSEISTRPPSDVDEKKLKKLTDDYEERIGKLNEILRAAQKHSLLVILQGMDGSGKDGAVKNVFKDCTPFNLSVYAFKKPTEIEFAHDFLWRVHQQVPAKGDIKIFNRSHYEDILIQRVHKWIDEERVAKRMAAINAFEELITFDNNTTILKFYLHISYDQQEKELKERIDEPDKHWKHNDGDWKERESWDEYMRCYEYAINESKIPWTVVPVDERWYRDYIISKKVCEALEAMNLEYPK
ncbi:MAG: polyphosphate kinase [Lewinellaceae bacterium]|nr:polyphosphate kinase [Saprospiraceae bacterium]MCB9340438.1 polyphosphate kinase [Lewinellaceae bacterium]